MKIHFVHTSDWHLGFAQYNKTERFHDFRKAVDRVIDEVLKIQPEFVLHTGDIFHHAKPNPGAIRHAYGILRRLKEANIPFYTIRGNHDGKNVTELLRGGNVVSLLVDLDIINYISEEIIEVNESLILGIGYHPGNASVRHLDEVLENNPNFQQSTKFKIIALHAYAEGQLKEQSQISASKLSELQADYIALGHYHIPWHRLSTRSWAPGSSEATSSNDWNRDDNENDISYYSSFYEIKSEYNDNNWSLPQVITHKISVRPKLKLKLTSNATNVEGLENEVINELRERQKIINIKTSNFNKTEDFKPMGVVRVSTNLNYDEIQRFSIINVKNALDFLYLDIQLEEFQKDTDVFEQDYISHDIESIIFELSELEGGDAQEFLEKTVDIINQLGEIPPSRELDDKLVSHLLNILLSRTSINPIVPLKIEPQIKTGLIEETSAKLTDKDKNNKGNLEEWF